MHLPKKIDASKSLHNYDRDMSCKLYKYVFYASKHSIVLLTLLSHLDIF